MSIPASPDVQTVTDLTSFVSPSGNIICDVAEWAATCAVTEHDWVIPQIDCEPVDFVAHIIQVGNDGDVFAGVCSGDTVISDPTGASATTLAYGNAIRLGDLQCTSRQTGMRCEHLGTEHGFEVSRASYQVF